MESSFRNEHAQIGGVATGKLRFSAPLAGSFLTAFFIVKLCSLSRFGAGDARGVVVVVE